MPHLKYLSRYIFDSLKDFLLTSHRKSNKLTNPIVDCYFEYYKEEDAGLIYNRNTIKSRFINWINEENK